MKQVRIKLLSLLRLILRPLLHQLLRPLLRLLFILFPFLFSSSAFAFGPTVNADSLIWSLVAAALASIALSVFVFIRLKRAFWQRLLWSLAVLPLCAAGCLMAVFIIKQADKLLSISTKQFPLDKQQEQQNLALRHAACQGKQVELEKALKSGQADLQTRLRVLKECIIPKSNQAGLRSYLQLALAQEPDKTAYCHYLDPVLMSMNTSLLDVFVEQKLSLVCPSTSYLALKANEMTPSWWDLLTVKHSDSSGLLNTLQYLKAHGVDMKASTSKDSMLTVAVDYLNTEAILFALDSGLDPYASPGETTALSAAESLLLERLYYARKNTFSNVDMQRLQARLHEMTAAEANVLAAKFMSHVSLDIQNDGADLLTYLAQHGVNLRILNKDGIAFLRADTVFSPALKMALNKLNDQQLLDFICPETSQDAPAYSMYFFAKKTDNQELMSFLKQRHMPETCSEPAHVGH